MEMKTHNEPKLVDNFLLSTESYNNMGDRKASGLDVGFV